LKELLRHKEGAREHITAKKFMNKAKEIEMKASIYNEFIKTMA
jgi:hypothetical protein